MANEFIARKGLIALENSQITGSLNISENLSLPGFTNVSASLAAAVAGGDNLGNHTATQNLNMGGNAITNVGNVDGVDVSTLNTNFNTLKTKTLVSSSAQISSDISGSFTLASASFSTRVTANDAKVSYTDAAVTSVINTAGVVSSSAQLDFVDTTGTPAVRQLAIFTGTDTIKGEETLTFSNIGGLVVNNASVGPNPDGITVHGGIFGSGSHIRLRHPDGGGGSGFYLSSSGDFAANNFKIFTGDIEGVGNSTLLTVDDLNEQITTSKTLGVTGNITVTGTVDGRDVAADGTKLDGIEASADVTDTTNVTSAGALMDSELTEIATVKALTAAGISGSFTDASASFSTRVTANDAKVSYTDAAVTSVINTAGIVSSSTQFDSSDNVAFGTIEATSLNVTSITSSIVTSSIIQTEGSNIFGDTSADTHTFTGSLLVTGGLDIGSGDSIFNGSIQVGKLDRPITLTGGNSFLATRPTITGGGSSYVSFDTGLNLVNEKKISFDGDTTNTYIAANSESPEDLEIHADQDIILNPDGQVIANSHISASGAITASAFKGDGSNLTNLPSQTDQNFTNADHSKLDGIEASADVTDATNVQAAGALMDSELAEIATVKALTAAGISGSFTPASASFSTRVTTNETNISSLQTDSASFSTRVTANDAKVSYTDAAVTSVINTAGIISSSAQIGVGDGLLSQNNFTNADHTKLNGIEASADVTDTTNVTSAGALMDSELSEIATVKALTAAGISGSFTDASASFSTRVTANDANILGLQTDSASFSTRVTANDAKVSYTDAAVTSVINTAGIISSSAQIGVGDGLLSQNNFTNTDHSKLDGIEASADVTDTSNVTSAGALMDSELADLAAVKAINQGLTTTSNVIFNHITASGHISASGDLFTTFLNLGSNDDKIFSDDTGIIISVNDNDNHVFNTTGYKSHGHITASSNINAGGNISASEDIIGKRLNVNGTQFVDLHSSGFRIGGSSTALTIFGDTIKFGGPSTISHVTASGDISASGTSTGSFGHLMLNGGNFTSASLASAIASAGGSSGISNIVEDTTPQLGGDLDTNGKNIAFGDNDSASFGAAGDLLIFHDGSDSFIKDAGTGDLKIQASTVKITDHDGSPTHITVSNTGLTLNSGNGLVNIGNDKIGNGTDEEYIEFSTTDIDFHVEDTRRLRVGDGFIDVVGNITASGNISASGTSTGSFGHLMLNGGNFTSASLASAIAGGGGGGGVDTSGTPADSQIAVFTDSDTIEGTSKLTFSNGDLLVHSTNADNSGVEIFGGVVGSSTTYISPVGSQTTMKFGDGDTGHIFDFRRNKLSFDGDSTNTYIQADSDDPENLEIHADNNIELNADNLVTMTTASIEHRLFDTGSVVLAADGGVVGDIVKFGGTSTTAGKVYYLKPDGAWGEAQADAGATASGSLAIALGSNSTTNGMCLRGFIHPENDPSAGIGSPVFLSDAASGRMLATAPDTSGDIVRILGHQFGTDLIYFNPSPDFIEVS